MAAHSRLRRRAMAILLLLGSAMMFAGPPSVMAAPRAPHVPLPPGAPRPTHQSASTGNTGGTGRVKHTPLAPGAPRPVHTAPALHGGRVAHRPR